jgi:aldehyde dehydrogenase (NAD+)
VARRASGLGAVLSAVGMTALVGWIIELPQHGAFGGRSAILLAVAVVALGGFVIWENVTAAPMVPLVLFKQRGERIARCTLELGGKSAAVILDDMDIATAARTLSQAECFLSGQVCSSLTRIVVTQRRHDELVEALASTFSQVRVGDPFNAQTQMGPLAASRQRDRVEGYIAKGVAGGATLATGGGRPKDLDRGWFVEPTVFGNVDNSSVIAQEEIFGPVLSVIPARDEQHAIAVANDTIYGLNASVFTHDVDRARDVARQLRSGTVGHNAFRTDFGIAFGGFKQSGIGREGGREGLLPFLETKTVILEGRPAGYDRPAQ